MAGKLTDYFPQLEEINNPELRHQVENCWMTALVRGGWDISDLVRIPFSLAVKLDEVSLAAHTKNVTDCCLAVGSVMAEAYGGLINIDFDVLTAGALLHDVGKALEYERQNGEWRVSGSGKMLRHPISGCALAAEFGLPEAVQHIIAVHSHEGDRSPRTAEAWILHHCDFINFDPFKNR